MTPEITPVVLCGGSGTRLWPLSRSSHPKQFVPLIGAKSLFQNTLERLSAFDRQIITVAAEEHRFLAADTLSASQTAGTLILEPEGRNTAAAIALAALACEQPGRLLLVCPADHHIPDTAAFEHDMRHGAAAAMAGAIVTFGVSPAYPSCAYGYIQPGPERPDGARQVARFIEKPEPDMAQALVLQGGALWNTGIFLALAGTLLDALRRHAPDILDNCALAMAEAAHETGAGGQRVIRPHARAFLACRAQSIDYAVIEHHGDIAVAPFHGQWSDVGNWQAVAQMTPADRHGNRIDGDGLTYDSSGTYIHAPHRPVVALGTQDLLIIDTPDALLVANLHNAEQVRGVVAHMQQNQRTQTATHRRVIRSWGWFDSIGAGERFQVKRIGVKPGASLSLQSHRHRAEHWIMVKGMAEVTRGGETFRLGENQSTYIATGEIHRLHNPGPMELEMIEVQSGGYLGEDDIQRYDETAGATPQT